MVSEVNIIQGQHHSNFALIHFYAQIIIILHITFSPRGKHDISNCTRFYTYFLNLCFCTKQKDSQKYIEHKIILKYIIMILS